MQSFFLTRFLRYLGDKTSGYKTYAGAAGKAVAGIGSIVTGTLGLLGIAYPDQGLPDMDADKAWALIVAGFYAVSSGLGTVGVGAKLEKAQDQRVEIAKEEGITIKPVGE
jgi:hypothetical protein